MTPLVFLAVIIYTLLAITLKAAASRVDSNKLIVVALAVVSASALLLMIFQGNIDLIPGGAFLAAAAGLIYYFASVLRVKALNVSPASCVFAITDLDLIVSGTILFLIPAFAVAFTPEKGV